VRAGGLRLLISLLFAPLLELRKRDLALELVAQVARRAPGAPDPFAEGGRDFGKPLGAEHQEPDDE
jgi:hypothetical protein